MLDNFQRITVEAVREHRGRISIALDNEEGTQVSTAFPDERRSGVNRQGISGKWNTIKMVRYEQIH